MKKFILLLILLVLFVPSNVLALDLHVSKSEVSSTTKNDFVGIDIDLELDNWGDIDTSNTGVLMYGIGLEFDSNDLVFLGAQSAGYVTSIYQDSESGMYVIVLTYAGSQNTECAYGYLSCAKKTSVKVNFQLKNSKCESTKIILNEAMAFIATITSIEDSEVELVDTLESTYYYPHIVEFPNNIKVTKPKTTTTISVSNIDKVIKTTKVATTKKITTKKMPSTSKTTTSKNSENIKKSTSNSEGEVNIGKNDIVENVLEGSKEYLEKLNDKDTQKQLIRYGLIIIGVIIILVIIIKLKNHRLNKKFKDF